MLDVHDRWPALDVPGKLSRLPQRTSLAAGPLATLIDGYKDQARRALAGLLARDPSAWSTDEHVQQTIANRLGWLSSPALMADRIPHLHAFASAIARDGFTDVVLLGMGGSSLAPEVLRAVLGPEAGWPRLHMLDSTDPAAIRAVSSPPKLTLYVLASKSGTTTEPNALAAHFRARLEAARVSRWADHFVAITDEGTPLAERARSEQFRELFINPGDIGGRYSALSYFGLVPAALMGYPIEDLLGWGLAMLDAAGDPSGDPAANPAAALGLLMGAAARAGRDKLTLLLPPSLEPFGLWVEQLIAESTGKQGTGIVPITGEPIGAVQAYGPDRCFVHLVASDESDEELNAARSMSTAGPYIELHVPEWSALGAEFVRWEIATAVAGALLGINPFDEPNVQQAKDATRALLQTYSSEGRLPTPPDPRPLGRAQVALTAAARDALAGKHIEIFPLLRPGDYFAVLAYLGADPAVDADLRTVRTFVRDRTRAATMSGYGPRYLHSTGQLHKGGPNTGVFLIITAEVSDADDLPIPGQPYSFATLEHAQAFGDFNSLDATGRRALLVRLPAASHAALTDAFRALSLDA
jgi:glucose-6-phosphate isomerase